ncbi:hypothetical protein CEXT_125861 [Caerostris extrusa]|uniref:Uncharacterized protein n=1 Tax=Caerostris extrusa TaxID=172846 RepID=A0AAV4QRM8_CAEEX|nr:hypothetical protein CEXT_125861 [Caerostris extrusa]
MSSSPQRSGIERESCETRFEENFMLLFFLPIHVHFFILLGRRNEKRDRSDVSSLLRQFRIPTRQKTPLNLRSLSSAAVTGIATGDNTPRIISCADSPLQNRAENYPMFSFSTSRFPSEIFLASQNRSFEEKCHFNYRRFQK